MHAVSSYRGNRPTNTKIHTQTHRQDRLQCCAPKQTRNVTIVKRNVRGHSVVMRQIMRERADDKSPPVVIRTARSHG